MDEVEFTDNRVEVKNALNRALISFLHEASSELASETTRNTRVDTGQLKSSWSYSIDEARKESVIGSPLQNAIWEEFGTGEYALNGDGRATPWVYQDRHGQFHLTHGKKPQRTLHNAFETKKGQIKRRLEEVVQNDMRGT